MVQIPWPRRNPADRSTVDDPRTAGTVSPDRSPLLARRVAAGLVDLTCVMLATAGTALVTSTRVPAIRRPDGSVTFDEFDRQLLNGMTGPLSRGQMLGDTLWAFSTTDMLVVAGAAAVASIVIGALIPVVAGGRSPGKILFRLQVITVAGGTPGLIRHLVRTLASPIDLMPLVVPGLTGFAFAASSPESQRVGDRLAGTIVTERQLVDDLVPVAAAIGVGRRSSDVEAPDRVPTIRSATLVVHAPTRVHAPLNRRPEHPDLDGDEVAKPRRAPFPAGATPADREHGTPEPQPYGDTVDMTTRDSASEQPTTESKGTPVPVEERSTNPYPKPVRRSREKAEERPPPDFDSLTLPESSLSDMPLTNEALFEALGLIPPGSASVETSGPNAVELSADATPRSSVAATTPTVAPTPTMRRGSRPAVDKRAPIWSEDWDAWIYWDTTLRTWFRHDMARGTWVPMDEA